MRVLALVLAVAAAAAAAAQATRERQAAAAVATQTQALSVPHDDAGVAPQPVQLVDVRDDKLVLNEAGLRTLEQWGRNTGQKFHVVAVTGKFHTGKSYLMNRLLGRSTGFATGRSVDPTTRGIWMWGTPVAAPGHEDMPIILVDTEGLAAPGNSPDFDAKIFAVATLLSSHLLYNSVKIIDEVDMGYLEQLARRARLFQASAVPKQ